MDKKRVNTFVTCSTTHQDDSNILPSISNTMESNIKSSYDDAVSSLHLKEQQPKANVDRDEPTAFLPFSELSISHPQNKPPRIRASLTPPPHSEKISRAIRTVECQLDAAVDDVQRYISRGCPDSDTAERCRVVVGSPESDYSDDMLSPKVLPDFNSPLVRGSLAFKSDQLTDEGTLCEESFNMENEEPNSNDRQTNTSAATKSNNQKPTLPPSPASVDNGIILCTMKGRVLRFNGSKFDVWPPLKGS
jgi:hypothetical protein